MNALTLDALGLIDGIPTRTPADLAAARRATVDRLTRLFAGHKEYVPRDRPIPTHSPHGHPRWTAAQDQYLRDAHRDGVSIADQAGHLGRSYNAVNLRRLFLGLARARPPIPVQCVETGEPFPTVSAAARSAKVTPRTIRMAVERGWTAGGFHWRKSNTEKAVA